MMGVLGATGRTRPVRARPQPSRTGSDYGTAWYPASRMLPQAILSRILSIPAGPREIRAGQGRLDTGNDLAVDDGQDDLRFQHVDRRGLEWVAVHDRQVGPHPGLQDAELILRKLGIRRSRGKGAQGFLGCHLLIGVPAAGGLAVFVLARERGVDPVKRIDDLDGKIATERDNDPLVQKPAPRIRPIDATGAEACIGPSHVIAGVRGLHRGDHAKLLEPGDVLPANDLRVLDPEPRVFGRRHVPEGGGIGVEHDRVPLVTDRRGANLPWRMAFRWSWPRESSA